jgi:hypothetical protein
MASSAGHDASPAASAIEPVVADFGSRPAAATAIAPALPAVTPRGEALAPHRAMQNSLTLQRKADHGSAEPRRSAGVPGAQASHPETNRSETETNRSETERAQRAAPALVWRAPDAAAIAARVAQTANAGSSPRVMRAPTDAPANLAAAPAAPASVASAPSAMAYAPALDIDRLADKVLRLIAGRLRVERERRGGDG